MSSENEKFIDRHIGEHTLKTLDLDNSYILPMILDPTGRVIFTKFGDGEHACMSGECGANCDGDRYSRKLGDHLCEAFLKLVDASNTDNIFIGRWTPDSRQNIWFSQYYFEKGKRINGCIPVDIPFVHYHFVHNGDLYLDKRHMYNLVKTIRESPKPKLVMTNHLNFLMTTIFRADFLVIPQSCWYDNYAVFKMQMFNYLHSNPNAIVLLSAGLASKVLIADLFQEFPQVSFIDCGSAFDMLCRNQNTRHWIHTFEQDYNYYKDFLTGSS